MADTSPQRPSPFRIGSLRNFLPLSDDTVSTRGQRLPSIIRERSTASVSDFRAQRVHRRQSSFINGSDGEQDIERDAGGRGRERGRDESGEAQRRMSNGSLMLLTPQMRSMRLIGNNNPRYRWFVLPARTENSKIWTALTMVWLGSSITGRTRN